MNIQIDTNTDIQKINNLQQQISDLLQELEAVKDSAEASVSQLIDDKISLTEHMTKMHIAYDDERKKNADLREKLAVAQSMLKVTIVPDTERETKELPAIETTVIEPDNRVIAPGSDTIDPEPHTIQKEMDGMVEAGQHPVMVLPERPESDLAQKDTPVGQVYRIASREEALECVDIYIGREGGFLAGVPFMGFRINVRLGASHIVYYHATQCTPIKATQEGAA